MMQAYKGWQELLEECARIAWRSNEENACISEARREDREEKTETGMRLRKWPKNSL